MALEVLSGPSAITVDGTAVDSATNSDGLDGVYLQGIGLFLPVAPHGEIPKFCAVQWDGTAYRRGSGSVSPLILNLRDGGLAFNDVHSLYVFDVLAARPEPTPFFSVTSGTLDPSIAVICADRYVKFSGSTIQYSALTDGQSFTTEHVWSGAAPGAPATISQGGAPNVVCVAFGSTGQIRFYDLVRRAEVGGIRYVGEVNNGVWYVPKYGVFLELLGTTVKILADAVRPASLANAVALASVQAGHATQLRTQVLGAQSEACVGELVNWSITAGAGALAQAQTETDANGYAYNQLVTPLGTSGSVTVQTSVSF